MNNCPKCGSSVNPGESFCRMCGASLLDNSFNSFEDQHSVQQDVQPLFQPVFKQNGFQSSNDFQSQNSSDDDVLVDAFIGKNADKIKKGDFSICTFFFGSIYALYRKMWLVGFAWIFGSIVVNMFLPFFGNLVSIGAHIWISIEFNKWYLSNVKEQVSSIKKMYPGKSIDELAKICRQKGGTTVVPVVIFSILLFLFIGLFVLFVVVGILSYSNYASSSFDGLSVPVPESFVESNFSFSNYKVYNSSFSDSSDSCSLTVSKSSTILYDDAKEYLESFVSDVDSVIDTKVINDITWYYAESQSTYNHKYYYTSQNEDDVYRVEFSIVRDDDGKCSKAYNTVLNFMEFK